MTAPPVTTVFLGGTANLVFALDFASSAPAAPSFGLNVGTSLPGATVSIADRVFVPGPVNASFQAPPASRQVVLTIPAEARTGTYEVGFTAATASGGATAVTASLNVIKASVKLAGKPKLNKKKGTAVLTVKVPGAGALTASGRGIVQAKKTATRERSLKLTIKSKGSAKAALRSTGKAKLKATLTFKPDSGTKATKSVPLTLKLG